MSYLESSNLILLSKENKGRREAETPDPKPASCPLGPSYSSRPAWKNHPVERGVLFKY